MRSGVCGIFGDPVSHSLSPEIHRNFGEQQGIKIQYSKMTAPAEGLAAGVKEFFHKGGKGLNITIPYKELAFECFASPVNPADTKSGKSSANGSQDLGRCFVHAYLSHTANTISNLADSVDEVKCEIANTDGLGLVRDITQNLGWKLAGTRILVFGTGGATRAIIPALAEAGVAEIMLANRTAAKATALHEHYQSSVTISPGKETKLGTIKLEDLAQHKVAYDLIINGSALGLGSAGGTDGGGADGGGADGGGTGGGAIAGVGAEFPITANLIHSNSKGYDLVYSRDNATAFASWMEGLGVGSDKLADGLGMLVEQAALSFRIWFGASINLDTASVISKIRSG